MVLYRFIRPQNARDFKDRVKKFRMDNNLDNINVELHTYLIKFTELIHMYGDVQGAMRDLNLTEGQVCNIFCSGLAFYIRKDILDKNLESLNAIQQEPLRKVYDLCQALSHLRGLGFTCHLPNKGRINVNHADTSAASGSGDSKRSRQRHSGNRPPKRPRVANI